MRRARGLYFDLARRVELEEELRLAAVEGRRAFDVLQAIPAREAGARVRLGLERREAVGVQRGARGGEGIVVDAEPGGDDQASLGQLLDAEANVARARGVDVTDEGVEDFVICGEERAVEHDGIGGEAGGKLEAELMRAGRELRDAGLPPVERARRLRLFEAVGRGPVLAGLAAGDVAAQVAEVLVEVVEVLGGGFAAGLGIRDHGDVLEHAALGREHAIGLEASGAALAVRTGGLTERGGEQGLVGLGQRDLHREAAAGADAETDPERVTARVTHGERGGHGGGERHGAGVEGGVLELGEDGLGGGGGGEVRRAHDDEVMGVERRERAGAFVCGARGKARREQGQKQGRGREIHAERCCRILTEGGEGDSWGDKLQSPNPKIQRSFKSQIPNERDSAKGFGISLELGFWILAGTMLLKVAFALTRRRRERGGPYALGLRRRQVACGKR